jgi:hypothetical protein
MIVGLSAAAMQGAPVLTEDIDLWFKRLDDPRLKDVLSELHIACASPSIEMPPMFAGAGLTIVAIVLTMSGLGEFEEEMQNMLPLSVGGRLVPVLKLERIIASKQAAGRAKDRLALPALLDALRTRQLSVDPLSETLKRKADPD